ncbi:hypothetical protein [Aurantiacibacter sediminis]|uniref:Uncharacterized protein n=1 Tax=Aurantiacibacter sediminis TaxID=2793064 RepID=A0ABS0N4G1_9SPHN|nr:hypothetical protein [Aurantiacibacter sediminis]MBH5322662.1 hypothetical protein [Aurantiacibacter sediminis]
MAATSPKPKKNRASLNLNMGIVGFASLIGLTAASALDAHEGIPVVLVLILVASLATMFFTRKSDEYTEQLWISGANAAFIMLVLWIFIAPAVAGFVEGYSAAHEGREADAEPQFDMLYAAGSTFSLYAFFITFHIKRLTGAF